MDEIKFNAPRQGLSRVWIIIISAIISGGIAGGSVYAYYNNKTTREKTNLQNQINDLDNQIKKLNAENTNSTNSNSSVESNTSTKSALNADIEKVDFSKIITVNTKLGDELLTPTYADLNNDNSEEALIVYQYAGTNATIDFYIYGFKDGNPIQLFKGTDLSHGSSVIKNNSIYVDYANLNSTLNKDKFNSDITIDMHVKYTWNGSTFAESDQ